jgi:hypothetical protein
VAAFSSFPFAIHHQIQIQFSQLPLKPQILSLNTFQSEIMSSFLNKAKDAAKDAAQKFGSNNVRHRLYFVGSFYRFTNTIIEQR